MILELLRITTSLSPSEKPWVTGRVGAGVACPPWAARVPWALPVQAVKLLLSKAALKDTANAYLSAVFGFNGKNDKSYQKYH